MNFVTSDIGIAEESRLMCEAMNCSCITSYDVGIAGLHRIFPVLKEFVKSGVDAIIVVAGMEGALASVVSSTVNVPIIGVPTSIGYGYGEKGVAALAAMLQSCSLGLTVVNIDNGNIFSPCSPITSALIESRECPVASWINCLNLDKSSIPPIPNTLVKFTGWIWHRATPFNTDHRFTYAIKYTKDY